MGSMVSGNQAGAKHVFGRLMQTFPKGQDRFPVHSYTSHVQRMKPQSLSLGEQREFAATCVRQAVEDMMGDELDNVYVSPEALRRGRQ